MKNKPPHIIALIVKHRRILRRTLLRISVYYLLVAALAAAAASLAPAFERYLPVGGVGDIPGYGVADLRDLEDAFLSADDEGLDDLVTETARAREERGPAWLRDAAQLLFAMSATLVLMLPVSWVYKSIHEDSFYDHSIDTTTLVLPAVVAGVVTVIQHSLALAFSLAGIVAGVRFRRALSDTFDTLFILAAIGVGIAAGVGSMEVAVILTVFFNYATIFVCMYGDGLESQHAVQRELRRREEKEAKEARRQAAAAEASRNSGTSDL